MTLLTAKVTHKKMKSSGNEELEFTNELLQNSFKNCLKKTKIINTYHQRMRSFDDFKSIKECSKGGNRNVTVFLQGSLFLVLLLYCSFMYHVPAFYSF